MLTAFYGALRALKLYPVENDAVQQALRELHSVVSSIASGEGEVELRVVGDFFFLNDVRLRLDLTNFSTFGGVAKVLGEHAIGSVQVSAGVEEDEWAPFLALLLRVAQGDDPFGAFADRLAGAPVEHIEIRPEKDLADQELEEEEALVAAKRTYVQSVKVAKDVLQDVRLGRAVNARKVKRAVQNIVDQVLANEPSMVTMTTLRDFDDYTFTHCINEEAVPTVVEGS